MNNTTIKFHGRGCKSIDSLIFKNICFYPEYSVAYLCNNEEDIKVKIDLFRNFKENFKDIFTRNFIKEYTKNYIIFENGSYILFLTIDKGANCHHGCNYDAIIIEDTKLFKEKYLEQYNEILKGILPVLSQSDKDGLIMYKNE
jgi:hypothetical protein